MAVKKVGYDDWVSTLTGHHYTSETAALHYDNLEKRRSRAASKGDQILDALSAEQIKSLATAMHSRIDEAANKPFADEQAGEWFAEHPEIIAEGNAGTANGAALGAWLRASGKNPPFSKHDLENAYQALTECGALHLSGKPKLFDEEAAYALPLQELEARARGWK